MMDLTNLLFEWWVWVCIALVLGLIEVLAPAFIFLGFALGALIMALLAALMGFDSLPMMLAVYGGLSLVCWILLKLVFRRQSSGARVITRDINDG